MLKLHKLQFLKTLLMSSFAIFAMSFAHGTTTNTSNMSGMAGHSTNSIHCSGICNTGLPHEKPDGVLQNERDSKTPQPPFYVSLEVVLALIAMSFVVKILLLLSSWRPPDLTRLYGNYLFYA